MGKRKEKKKERGEGAVVIRDCMKRGWSACGTGGRNGNAGERKE